MNLSNSIWKSHCFFLFCIWCFRLTDNSLVSETINDLGYLHTHQGDNFMILHTGLPLSCLVTQYHVTSWHGYLPKAAVEAFLLGWSHWTFFYKYCIGQLFTAGLMCLIKLYIFCLCHINLIFYYGGSLAKEKLFFNTNIFSNYIQNKSNNITQNF